MRPLDLVDLLVPNRGAEGRVLILRAYFDESGHSDDPRESVVSLAGSLAPLETWSTFEVRWAGMLSRFEIPDFHMKYFAHSLGAFIGWKEERRRALLQDVIECIQPLSLHLGGAVLLDEYALLSEAEREQLLDPYYPCLQTCLNHALDYALQSEDSRIQVIFAHTPEFSGRVSEMFEVWRKAYDPLGLIASVTVVQNPTEVLPLQAADFVAYEVATAARHAVKTAGMPFRWPMQQLMTMERYFKYFDRARLLEGF